MKGVTLLMVLAGMGAMLAMAFGIVTMARGRSAAPDRSIALMWARVGFHALAVALLLLALWLR